MGAPASQASLVGIRGGCRDRQEDHRPRSLPVPASVLASASPSISASYLGERLLALLGRRSRGRLGWFGRRGRRRGWCWILVVVIHGLSIRRQVVERTRGAGMPMRPANPVMMAPVRWPSSSSLSWASACCRIRSLRRDKSLSICLINSLRA